MAMASTQIQVSMKSGAAGEKPRRFHATFFEHTPERAASRAAYLKIVLTGIFLTVVLIFTSFVIFWNAFAKSPDRNLSGWIVVCQAFKVRIGLKMSTFSLI